LFLAGLLRNSISSVMINPAFCLSFFVQVAMPTSTLSPQDFVAKWRHAALKEISAYSEHFIDLCRLVGHPTPGELDPRGNSSPSRPEPKRPMAVTASPMSGSAAASPGSIRASTPTWTSLPPAFAVPRSLGKPALAVVCDLDQIIIHTNFTNSVKRAYPLALDDLLKPEGLATLRSVFYNPEALKAVVTSEQVTRQAAAHFSPPGRAAA